MTDIGPENAQYLKHVSRIKHQILGNYLSPWMEILGSAHRRLIYIDCFAGEGVFKDEHRQGLPGSPVIALRLASAFVQRRNGRSFLLGFAEKDHDTAEHLQSVLSMEKDVPASVTSLVHEESAQDFVEAIIASVKKWGPGARIVPTFFFVDPYGHPITVPAMRKLLALGQTEILVNLMWFRINMDLNNPSVQARVDYMFGNSGWRSQPFMFLQGHDRESAFVDYFVNEVGARYALPFRFPFSPEDRVPAKDKQTKYYLIHFSQHPKAALLMKRVMWTARNAVEELRFMVDAYNKQPALFGSDADTGADIGGLGEDLLHRFHHTEISFEDIQLQTLTWAFVEKHYRQAVLSLEARGAVTVRRIVSKKRGLQGRDIVAFP